MAISPALPVIMLKTPFGMPASSASCARARAAKGVALAGFTIMGQPTASAGPAFLKIIPMGKFQGVTAKTVPTGSYQVMGLAVGTMLGMVAP